MRQMAFTKGGREERLDALSDTSELDMDDRRTLDEAVLEMLGVKAQRDRKQLLDNLYAYLREFFEGARLKEEIAIANKNRSKRKAALTPPEIAAEILSEIRDKKGHLLQPYQSFVDMEKPYSTFYVPHVGIAEVHEDIFEPHGSVRFMKGRRQISLLSVKSREQANLISVIASRGVRGLVRVPLESRDCANLQRRYEAFLKGRDQSVRVMIADRTSDSDLQEQIFKALDEAITREAGI
jgi:hypothetical protein